MASQYEEIEEVAKRPFNYAHFRRMLRYSRPYRRQLGVVVAVMILGSVLRLTEPYLLRTAIDVGIIGRDLEVLNRVSLLWVMRFLGLRHQNHRPLWPWRQEIVCLRPTRG